MEFKSERTDSEDPANMGPDSPDSGAESIHPEDALLEEEGDELLIVDLDDDDSLSSVSLSEPEEIWDEPEPDVDFDPDLSEPLYVETSIRGLSKTLRIGEFIAGVGQITDEQQELIREILGEFTAVRLKNWLSWLSTKDWTGDNLLLFMEFWREYWMETPEWWELTIRTKEHHKMMSIYNYQSLSRDGMYELIQNRMDYDPSEIIDWSWLDDWNSRQMWKRGFYSFANFAVFRSSIHPTESWEHHLNLGQARMSEEGAEGLFTSGYWYDSAEWDDGFV